MFRVMTIERPGDKLKELMKKYGYVFVKKLFAERDGKDFGEELWAHESVLRGPVLTQANNEEIAEAARGKLEKIDGKLEKIDGKVVYVPSETQRDTVMSQLVDMPQQQVNMPQQQVNIPQQ